MWDNRSTPGGAINATRGLTHSSDFSREGLAMKATRCSIPECANAAPKIRRGWCPTHYHRWRRHGDPLYEATKAECCTVAGCDGEVHLRDLCTSHYRKLTRHGDPLFEYQRHRRNLTGHRFGLLVALEPTDSQHWLCRCDCGTKHPVRTASLTREGNGTKTCGHPRHMLKDGNYDSAHRRVRKARGRARDHACVDCGTIARHWSYDHADPNALIDERGYTYSLSPMHYQPRCVACHSRFDRGTK